MHFLKTASKLIDYTMPTLKLLKLIQLTSIARNMAALESCLEKARQKKDYKKYEPSAEWGRESGDKRHGRS